MTNNAPYPVQRHEYVTALVDNIAKSTFKFSPNENLKNKKIKGITFHPNQYITRGPNQEQLVSNANGIGFGFITLKTVNGVEVVNKLPLYIISAGVAASGTYERIFATQDLVIDWENSYITMGNTSILTAGQVFLVSVFYEDDTCTR